MSSTDTVSVSVEVNMAPADAFELFTRDIGKWWLTGPRFHFKEPWDGEIHLEIFKGGRLLEISKDSDEVYTVGEVLICDQNKLLVFEWRLPNFESDEVTEVSVRFDETPDGTKITLEHSGWNTISLKSPARHGKNALEHNTMIFQWWTDQMLAAKNLMQ